MPASIKNVLIGIFVLAAISIVIFMLLFLHPSVGDNAKTLRVRFNDIDKVNVGTRVTFAGKPVGEVVSIRELPDARTTRHELNGEIYVYELVLKVDSSVDVFNSDVIMLRTSGLLGERNIEINPEPLKQGEQLKIVNDEILYAAVASSVEDTMKEIGQLTQKIGVVLDDFHQIMADIKHTEIIDKVGKSIDNVLDVTHALNQPDKWHQIIDNMTQVSQRVNDTWSTVDTSLKNFQNLTDRAKQSWNTVDASLDNVYQLTSRAQESWTTVDRTLNEFHATAQNVDLFSQKANHIIDYTAQGQGTLGQLLIGDDLYLRFKSILHKGEVVMDDMNHFGLLYHLDKRWQRLQGQRLRLLERLSNPNAFAKYFNDEMEQISSSLSRVSQVIDGSACNPQSLISNPQFTHRFAELMRRVDNMEETLKLYNEQVVSQDNPY